VSIHTKESRNNKIFISPSSRIVLSTVERGSGLKSLYYRIYTDAASKGSFEKYTKSIPISSIIGQGKGIYILEFYGVDRIGNKEEIKRLFLKL